MKILITGNMGYLGSVLVPHLRKIYPDAVLAGFDKGLFGHCLTGGILPECNLDAQYFGDIRKFPERQFYGIDTIIHLAAVSNDPMGNKFEKATHEINYEATCRLADKALAIGVKNFIFASSCSMYGAGGSAPRKETDELNPLTVYAKSKVASEKYLQTINKMKVTCLRFATLCGMSPRLRTDLVLNDFVQNAIVTKRINVLSDGTPWRPLLDVKDAARAINWAIGREGDFLAVNVGSKNYQVSQIAGEVAKITGATVFNNPNPAPDKRSYQVDFSLFKSLAPDYQPAILIRKSIDGMAGFRNNLLVQGNRLETLDSHIKNGLITEDLWA